MGFEGFEAEEGQVTFFVTPAEYHYNPIGVVHGGLAATLFDSALGCAIHSTLPEGTGYTTLELKVNYLRPLTVDTGRVRCEADVDPRRRPRRHRRGPPARRAGPPLRPRHHDVHDLPTRALTVPDRRRSE